MFPKYRSSGKNPALPNICGGNRVRALPAQVEDVDFSPGGLVFRTAFTGSKVH
jgi:hypothetical protein